MVFVRLCLSVLIFAVATTLARAEVPTSLGLTGLINMPSARAAPDGTLYMGYSRDQPYGTAYSALQVLPGLQISGRYTRIDGLRAMSDEFGSYKDKSAGFKLRLLPENSFGQNWIPEISVGAEDFHGTSLFRSEFIAATKAFDVGSWGKVDVTMGYGRKRIDGLYGGLRFTPVTYRPGRWWLNMTAPITNTIIRQEKSE